LLLYFIHTCPVHQGARSRSLRVFALRNFLEENVAISEKLIQNSPGQSLRKETPLHDFFLLQVAVSLQYLINPAVILAKGGLDDLFRVLFLDSRENLSLVEDIGGVVSFRVISNFLYEVSASMLSKLTYLALSRRLRSASACCLLPALRSPLREAKSTSLLL